jgi:hypothetical protein
MATAARVRTVLNGYERVFRAPIVEAVAETAARQDRHDFRSLAGLYGIENGPEIVQPTGAAKPAEVLHIDPQQYRGQCGDPASARLLYAPMGNAVGPHIVMRALRLFGVDHAKQLFVVGSPGFAKEGAGTVPLRALGQVGSGNFGPLVDPVLRYLKAKGIAHVEPIGVSLGADKALATAEHAAQYGIRISRGVFLEPAGSHKRPLRQLVGRFVVAGGQLDRYVQQSDSGPYTEARAQMGGNLALYGAGLLRATNIATAVGLASGSFGERLDRAMVSQERLRVAIGWGSASELADNSSLSTLVVQAAMQYEERVEGMLVPGMHHAGPDDINLHAALVLEGLARTGDQLFGR